MSRMLKGINEMVAGIGAGMVIAAGLLTAADMLPKLEGTCIFALGIFLVLDAIVVEENTKKSKRRRRNW